MPQLFPRTINIVAKTSLILAPLGLALALWAGIIYTQSSYGTGVGVSIVQPIQFSHAHHVGILLIDCRYCHTSVESSSFAGIPPTKTCMNCHSQIWVGSEMLAPVRESYRTGQPLHWKRVYNLPDFVYFNHSIHVQKGVGCDVCHGRVDRMPFTFQATSLLMQWCIDCHRDPAAALRPRAEVFNLQYEYPDDQRALGAKLVIDYHIKSPEQLTSCSVCHR